MTAHREEKLEGVLALLTGVPDAVLAERPDPLSPRLAMPGGFHPASRRLIHCWTADAPLPEALSL